MACIWRLTTKKTKKLGDKILNKENFESQQGERKKYNYRITRCCLNCVYYLDEFKICNFFTLDSSKYNFQRDYICDKYKNTEIQNG